MKRKIISRILRSEMSVWLMRRFLAHILVHIAKTANNPLVQTIVNDRLTANREEIIDSFIDTIVNESK